MLEPYIPLFQTLTWPVFIGLCIVVARKRVRTLLDVIQSRIERGSSVKAGPIELGQDIRELDYVQPSLPESAHASLPAPAQPDAPDWVKERADVYAESRGVFLAHVLEPSRQTGQAYDIFIFLVRHKSSDFTDVECAEFFFGNYWGNEVFREKPNRGLVGVSTSAYGPFLCTCRVRFRDGHVAFVHRYIDFEMGRVFENAPN
jgi:hypothetical protein